MSGTQRGAEVTGGQGVVVQIRPSRLADKARLSGHPPRSGSLFSEALRTGVRAPTTRSRGHWAPANAQMGCQRDPSVGYRPFIRVQVALRRGHAGSRRHAPGGRTRRMCPRACRADPGHWAMTGNRRPGPRGTHGRRCVFTEATIDCQALGSADEAFCTVPARSLEASRRFDSILNGTMRGVGRPMPPDHDHFSASVNLDDAGR